VTEPIDPLLNQWESFYVIVGSSGGALIGLQFVVITLIAGMRRRVSIDSINAFGTPTVVHLTGALLVSAIMSAPWTSVYPASLALVVCGLCGFLYCAIVIRRARRQTDYKPVREDWLWYAAVPSGTYAALALAALFLGAATRFAMFVIGGAALGLLLLGIRNAWDAVVHMVSVGSHGDHSKAE
jgi:hypothetical protein